MRRNINLFSLLFFSLICGCSKPISEENEHAHYVRGQKLLRENAPQEALTEFLKVIKTSSRAQKSYLEAGQIYLNTYDDPILAIYYFRQFLLYNYKKQNEKAVSELIETAKKRFLQQMIGQNRELSKTHQNFLSLLKHLREENDQLRAQLEAIK